MPSASSTKPSPTVLKRFASGSTTLPPAIILGWRLHVLGRHVEAAGAFLAVLDSRPDDALAHTNLGAALRELGDKSRALEHMRRAVELDPRLAPARNNLGQFLLESGCPDQALPHCQAAIALQPEMPEAHNNLGNAYRALGHYAEARWCYAEAIRLNPQMSHACTSLALTLQLEGRWDDALPWLRRATELQPGSLEYWKLLAKAEVEREHFPEAIDCYQEIIKRDPDDAKAHNTLGLLLQEEGAARSCRRPRRDRRYGCSRNSPSPTSRMAVSTKRRATSPPPRPVSGRHSTTMKRSCHALARLAMLLKGKLPDVDCQAIEEAIADSNTGRPGPDQPFLRSGERLGRAPALPGGRRVCARPTPWHSPSSSGEIWCTIRPSTSGSFPS